MQQMPHMVQQREDIFPKFPQLQFLKFGTRPMDGLSWTYGGLIVASSTVRISSSCQNENTSTLHSTLSNIIQHYPVQVQRLKIPILASSCLESRSPLTKSGGKLFSSGGNFTVNSSVRRTVRSRGYDVSLSLRPGIQYPFNLALLAVRLIDSSQGMPTSHYLVS